MAVSRRPGHTQEQEGPRVTYSQCGSAQTPPPLPPPTAPALSLCPGSRLIFSLPHPTVRCLQRRSKKVRPRPRAHPCTFPPGLAPCLTPTTFPWAGDTVGKVGSGCRLPPGPPAHTPRGCGDEALPGPPAGRWGRPAPTPSAEPMAREGAGPGRRVLRSTRTLWTAQGRVEKSRGGETGQTPPPCPG